MRIIKGLVFGMCLGLMPCEQLHAECKAERVQYEYDGPGTGSVCYIVGNGERSLITQNFREALEWLEANC